MQQRFETFTVLIAKISRSIRRIKAEEMSEFHLKGPHVSCLYYLTQLGPLTAGQLCDRCEEDKAAVSRSLGWIRSSQQAASVRRSGGKANAAGSWPSMEKYSGLHQIRCAATSYSHAPVFEALISAA